MELKVLLLLFLWCCSAPVQSSVIQRYLWYKYEPKTWDDAQAFCRRTYQGDLATVKTKADLRNFNLNTYYAWFGVRIENGETWEWSGVHTSTSGDSRRKKRDLTVYAGIGEDCGKVQYLGGVVFSDVCDAKLFVICEEADDQKHFFPKTMTWDEGLAFCKSKNMMYMNDIVFTNTPLHQLQHFPVWIGLNHKGNDWSWSDGIYSDYRNWSSDPGSGSCVAVSSQSKTMLNKSCDESYPFVCYRHNVVLLKEELSWENALETCMTLKNAYNHTSFSFLSVEENELKYVQSFAKGATTSKVWVGLRFLAGTWFWSDGSPVSLSLDSCPVGHCGALVVSTASASDPVIEPTDCSEKLNVFCYGSGTRWTVQ